MAEQQNERIPDCLVQLWKFLKSRTDDPIIQARCQDLARMDCTLFGEAPQQALREILSRLTQIGSVLPQRGPEIRAGRNSRTGPVLVVDDDEICGSLAQSTLQKHGFEVIVVNDIPAAKDALAKRHPALVLMDVHLGRDNGIEFVKLLRTASPWPDIPVIVVTGDRLKRTVLRTVDVNVQGYLVKPYQPDALVAKVRKVLGRSEVEV